MSAEGDNATAATLSAVKCMEHSILVEVNERSQDLHDWLLILAGALVFFMQAGFAVLCAGCVRKKNVQKYVPIESMLFSRRVCSTYVLAR